MKGSLEELLTEGREPWLPHEEAKGLAVLASNVMPTLGTFLWRKRIVLFQALEGQEEETQEWKYTFLTPKEYLYLTFRVEEELEATVESFWAQPREVALGTSALGQHRLC